VTASVEALRAASSENASRAEASWTRLVQTSQEETAAQCSTALTASSDSLRAEAQAAQTRVQEEMAALSSEVQGSLRGALQSTSQQLELFAARASGRANLTDHRVTQAETRLSAMEGGVQQAQTDLQAAVGEAAHSRKEVSRLAEGQAEQAERLWDVMNASVASAVRVSELSSAAAGASQLLDDLDQSVRRLALNCSTQAGLLQGALLQASEARAVGERQHSATEARLLALDEKLSKSQDAVGAVQLQLGGAGGSLPALQQEVVRVEGRVDVASEAVLGLQGQVLEAQAAAKQVQGDTAALQRRLDEVTSATLPTLAAGLAEVTASSEKGLERQAAQHQHLVDKTLAAADEKAAKMEQRLGVVELLVAQQEARIEALVRENEALKRSTAAQESVDDLRRLLQELQASMLQQSSKVLDLIVANLAAGGGNK